MSNRYKIFFTINFIYKISKKKKITKSFKSDFNLMSDMFETNLDDSNVKEMWQKYALANTLNTLNPPNEFEEKKVSEKKLTTHRIVNINNLTEVF